LLLNTRMNPTRNSNQENKRKSELVKGRPGSA
jgi:hypothetical protein